MRFSGTNPQDFRAEPFKARRFIFTHKQSDDDLTDRCLVSEIGKKKTTRASSMHPSDPRSINYTQQHSFCHLRVAFVRFLIHLSLRTRQEFLRRKNRIRKVTNIDWIFFCLCFDFTSANSRFAGFAVLATRTMRSVLRKLNIWRMATVSSFFVLSHKLFMAVINGYCVLVKFAI